MLFSHKRTVSGLSRNRSDTICYRLQNLFLGKGEHISLYRQIPGAVGLLRWYIPQIAESIPMFLLIIF